MSESLLQLRLRLRKQAEPVFDWFGDFEGTKAVEFGCALRLISLAGSVVSHDSKGNSVAPFLSSTVFSFDQAGTVVLTMLIIVGCCQLLTLAMGTMPRRQGKEEEYGARSVCSFCAVFCLGFIVLAMMQAGQPFAVVFTYFLALALNLFNAIVLLVKHKDAKETA